jgi:NitT/TauT family transport system substrate-binding protein
MKLQSRIITFCFALLLLFTQGCAQPQREQVNQVPDLGTIQIGYLPTMGFAGFYIAAEKGYFEEQGLKVELQRFDSGSKMMAPLSTGQLDMGGGEPGTAIFNAVSQDLDVRIVCGLSVQAPGFGGVPLLVRKDLNDSGEVTEVADLAGRKIAINVSRGMSEFTVSEALAQAGLTIEDVVLVELPFPDTPAAFTNKAVDASPLPYPLAAKALTEGSAVVLLEGDKIGGSIQNGVIYFGKRLLEPENKEVAIRVMAAYLKGNREIQGNGWQEPGNLEILNKYTNLPIDVIKASVRSHNDPNCEIVQESLLKVQAYYVSRGYTEYSEPLPKSSYMDDTFIVETLKRIGKFEE